MVDQKWLRELKELIAASDVSLSQIGAHALQHPELAAELGQLTTSAMLAQRPIRDLQHALALVGTRWLLQWISQHELEEQPSQERRAA